MKIIILVGLLATQVLSISGNPVSDELIDYINSKEYTWKAGRNFDENTAIGKMQNMLGSRKNDPNLDTLDIFVHPEDIDIPESFDVREKWPECKDVFNRIPDESICDTSAALASTSIMADRRCILSKGKLKAPISAVDVFACAYTGLVFGCSNIGYDLRDILRYWYTDGIVTGGQYNSSEGCKPYPMEPCAHNNASNKEPCSELKYNDPICTQVCDDPSLNYDNELTFAANLPLLFPGVENIQREILTNGPVVADYAGMEDFLNYKSGVYQRTSTKYINHFKLRIIGWGVENDLPYWLIANSWNEDWGENGFGKIIRGKNEVFIEEKVIASLPKI